MICILLYFKILILYFDMYGGKNNFDFGIEVLVCFIFYLCICDLCLGMFDLCVFLIDVYIFDLCVE